MPFAISQLSCSPRFFLERNRVSPISYFVKSASTIISTPWQIKWHFAEYEPPQPGNKIIEIKINVTKNNFFIGIEFKLVKHIRFFKFPAKKKLKKSYILQQKNQRTSSKTITENSIAQLIKKSRAVD